MSFFLSRWWQRMLVPFVMVLVMGISVVATPQARSAEAEGLTSAEILQRANDLAGQQRFKEAAYFYRRLLREDPPPEAAVLGLARCMEQLQGKGDAGRPRSQTPALKPNPDEGITASQESSRPQEGAETAAKSPAADLPPQPAEEVVREPVADQPAAPIQEVADQPVPEVSVVADQIRVSDQPGHKPQDSETEDFAPGQPSLVDDLTDKGSAETSEAVDSGNAPAVGGGYLPVVIGALALVVVGLTGFLIWRHRRNCTVRGQVEKFPVADLLQWISIGRKEGHLKVSARAAGVGHLYLKQGTLVRAEIGDSRGKPAVFAILSLARGRFVFREEPLPSNLKTNLDLPVPQVLMSWACAVDESNRETVDEGPINIDSINDSTLNIDLPF